MSYDPKCKALAAQFLSDYKLEPDERARLEDRLAQAIQQEIEGFIEVEMPEAIAIVK